MSECEMRISAEDVLGIYAEKYNIALIISRELRYAFTPTGEAQKLIERLNLEKIDRFMVRDAGGALYICVDEKTCYDVNMLRTLCADLSFAYAKPDSAALFRLRSAPGWWVFVEPEPIEDEEGERDG